MLKSTEYIFYSTINFPFFYEKINASVISKSCNKVKCPLKIGKNVNLSRPLPAAVNEAEVEVDANGS